MADRRGLKWPAGLLLAALLGAWLAAGVATAEPASAHAVLESTDPADGARLAAAPSRVTLHFDEPVSLAVGYLRVVSADGARADTGTPKISGAAVSVALRSGLPDAGYVAIYRVESDDGHPVTGTFTFVVGNAAAVLPGAAASGAGKTDPVVAVVLPVARWLGFAGLTLAVGLPFLLAVCWPAGWERLRLRRLAAWGLLATGVGAAASFLVQGPYAAGVGLGSSFDPALVSATAGGEYGRMVVARLVLVVLLAGLALPWWRRGVPPGRGVLAIGGVLGLGLVVSTAAVGHAVSGALPVLEVLVSTVHVGAMAVWIGGLIGVLAGVLRDGVPVETLAAVLPRFSRMAFTAVTALVLSGIVQAVREVGSPAALTSTSYGRLLTAKLVLVLVILAAAGVSRAWVQQHLRRHHSRPGGRRRVTAHALAATEEELALASAEQAGPTAKEAGRALAELPAFRRSVLVELAVAVVVLALSAVLVDSPPAKAVVAQPVEVTLPLRTPSGPAGSVQVSLEPARPGPNTMHLYLFDPSGQQLQPTGIRVTLTEPQQRIGPTDVWLQPGGPGHYLSESLTLPVAGQWRLEIAVGLGGIDAATASTTVTVR